MMMTKSLAFLLSLTAVAIAAPFDTLYIPPQYVSQYTGNSVCLSTNLKSCENGFLQRLNLTDSDSWTDPTVLMKGITNLYLQGMSGLLSVCSARQQYQLCLGTMYDACMNVQQFVSAGETPDFANDYVQIFREMEFDCNGGFMQLAQNDKCISNIWNNYQEDFAQCVAAYNATITKDPTQICPASYQYEKCTRIPFLFVCGPEASWWQCERSRIAMGLNEKCPQNYCQVITVSATEGNIKQKYSETLQAKSSKRDILRRIATGMTNKN